MIHVVVLVFQVPQSGVCRRGSAGALLCRNHSWIPAAQLILALPQKEPVYVVCWLFHLSSPFS